MKNKLENIFIVILGVLVGFLAFALILLAIYKILFKDSVNQATIFSGILSLFGGIAGATAAYLIARLQMTKQLDLQFNKEKHKMKLEIEIDNLQSLLQLLTNMRMNVMKIKSTHLDFINYYKEFLELEKLKVNIIKLGLTDSEAFKASDSNLEKKRDDTNRLYKECKKNINEIAFQCGELVRYGFIFTDIDKFNKINVFLADSINMVIRKYRLKIVPENIEKIEEIEGIFEEMQDVIEKVILDLQQRLVDLLNDYEKE
ncbi:hypothetical protein ACIQ4I_05605 [Rummeliibacillus sp. NPDC094406]|uniref:hypothetical protein n=1 Tax=Rummeliibacillus sp. NPDC094406 TaxID=3364511 RepID=UPI0038006F88